MPVQFSHQRYRSEVEKACSLRRRSVPLPVTASVSRLPRLPAGLAWPSVTSATERREQLKAVYEQARECTRCPLHQTRTTVVFGSGNADAELMFVGEAPGANEDKQGLPFVGQAGKLLSKLLTEIGLDRSDVFICNTVKCRPPNNRDPHPEEIESCSEYLHRQVELIAPNVICTLGNFSTKLLREDNTGISRLHGQAEIRMIGPRAIRLYPLYHPAAALYTPSTLEVLRADFARIPELLALGAPAQPVPVPTSEPAQTPPGDGGDAEAGADAAGTVKADRGPDAGSTVKAGPGSDAHPGVNTDPGVDADPDDGPQAESEDRLTAPPPDVVQLGLF
jgi:uracil-DNA glycosylase family 4